MSFFVRKGMLDEKVAWFFLGAVSLLIIEGVAVSVVLGELRTKEQG